MRAISRFSGEPACCTEAFGAQDTIVPTLARSAGNFNERILPPIILLQPFHRRAECILWGMLRARWLWAFLFGSIPLWAQSTQGLISGRVYSLQTGRAIA